MLYLGMLLYRCRLTRKPPPSPSGLQVDRSSGPRSPGLAKAVTVGTSSQACLASFWFHATRQKTKKHSKRAGKHAGGTRQLARMPQLKAQDEAMNCSSMVSFSSVFAFMSSCQDFDGQLTRKPAPNPFCLVDTLKHKCRKAD